MICGITSGAIGSAIANPTDVLKVLYCGVSWYVCIWAGEIL